MRKTILLIALLTLYANYITYAQRITVTIAGRGTTGFSGDAGPAKDAELNGPNDVCVDAMRNLYFTDHNNGRIRKVSATTGIITTIAGGGTSVSDGVPATDALLSPNYLCINAAGDIYLTSENYVKKISGSTSLITTVAGGVVSGYSGDMGPASAALLSNPQGICLDGSGNIYIVDRNNNAIRKIDVVTNVITTIAGGGPTVSGYSGDNGPATAAFLNAPAVICSNIWGDIYFSDQSPTFPLGADYACRIRKISSVAGIITTVAGCDTAIGTGTGTVVHSAPATACVLGSITGLCCDAAGNIFSNEMSCSCRMLGIANDTLYSVAGNFFAQGYSDDVSSTLADMDHPNGLCIDATGTLYVADNFNDRIRKIIPLNHTPTFTYGSGQTITPGPGLTYPITTQLAITDIDSVDVETWRLLTPPSHGIATGLPKTAFSRGRHQIAVPASVAYISMPGYIGPDTFSVLVTDGILSDTLNIYVNVIVGGGGTIWLSTNIGTINNTLETLEIYPNPASSTINITLTNSDEEQLYVVITDVTGCEVYSRNIINAKQASNVPIDITSLPAGSYLVKINGSNVRKLVKQ